MYGEPLSVGLLECVLLYIITQGSPNFDMKLMN